MRKDFSDNIEAIDLFCGIGGLTYGLRKAGIRVLAGLDNDETCRYSYEKNNKAEFIHANITEYNFNKMKALYSKNSIKVLVGCAPCQPFSPHGLKANIENDERKNLISYFLDAVKILKPDIISMENVRGMIKDERFKKFERDIKDLGYNVYYDIVNCSDYGVPQMRQRLVLLASKHGEIKLVDKTSKKPILLKDVIKSLPPLESGKADGKDPIHRARELSPLNIKRIKSSKPWGSWDDWDKNLLPQCYLKKSGQSYKNIYGRMDWNKLSPTITTQFSTYGCGRFGHPDQDRALSIREGALIQTFPKEYKFRENFSISEISRQIGNAVPPKLGEAIGKSIIEHLESLNYGV